MENRLVELENAIYAANVDENAKDLILETIEAWRRDEIDIYTATARVAVTISIYGLVGIDA